MIDGAKEHERLERQHKAFVALTNDQLIIAPVRNAIRKVIDIGCGTGVVTRELRKHFTDAEHIYGIDLTEVDLHSGQDNGAEFIHGDIMTLAGTDPRLAWGSVDFVWSRFLLCGLKGWQGYTDRILKLLRPGAWAQMVDFCEDFYFDPAISKRPRAFVANQEWEWLRALREAAHQKGLDLDAGLNIPKYMEKSGFVDIQTLEFRVPFWWDALEKSPEARLVMEQSIDDPYALYWHMIPKMVEKMGYSQEQVRQFQEDSLRGCSEELGKYQALNITIGRKPEA